MRRNTPLLLGTKYSDQSARGAIITCMCTNKCSYSFGIDKKSTVLLEELDLANVVELFFVATVFLDTY